MVAFELATRSYPWAGLDATEIMEAVRFHKARPELPADVDPRLAALIRDCIRHAPEERPSAAEVGARARALAKGCEASADEIFSVRKLVNEQDRARRDAAAASAGLAGAATVPARLSAPNPAPPSPVAASAPAAAGVLAAPSPSTGPTDLFVSYPWGAVDPATGKRPLQERVLAIVALLRAAGFTVWLDLERMASNATAGVGVMPDAMSSRIRGASPVVCFVAE